MRILLTALAATCLCSSLVLAGEISAERRYDTIKEQTKHTGSVGFYKRHNAYKDYVLQLRDYGNASAAHVSGVSPAAGDEKEHLKTQDKSKDLQQ